MNHCRQCCLQQGWCLPSPTIWITVVSYVSNKVDVYSIHKIKWWSRSDGKRVDIEHQVLIKHYTRPWAGLIGLTRTSTGTAMPFVQRNVCGPSLYLLLGLLHSATGSRRKLWTRSTIFSPSQCRATEREFLARGPRPLSPGRPTGFAASQRRVLEQIRFNRLDHLVKLRPTQLKCACFSMKTQHRYCKCKAGIHGRYFLMVHT